MAPELKKWLHSRPTQRDWKKRAKRGEIIPSLAIEQHRGLKRFMKRHGRYLLSADAMILRSQVDNFLRRPRNTG